MDPTWDEIEALLKQLSGTQNRHLFSLGSTIVPTLTSDDLLQPNDYPQLEENPLFRYEEGVLNGILTVQMALKALKNDLES